jgi:hypothetical protein
MRALCLVLCLTTACSGPQPSAASFNFLRPAAGKADGQTAMLSADDLQRIDAQLTAAIARADQEIASLEMQIAGLEQQLAGDQATINSIVNSIQQRRDEITRNQRIFMFVGILGLFTGLPAVAGLGALGAIDQDSRIQQLNRDLSAAQSKSAQVQQQIAMYTARRDQLRAKLDPLKQTYAALKKLLADGTTPVPAAPEGVDAQKWSQLAAERGRVDTLGKVLANAQQQVALLQQILTMLQATHDAVDKALAVLQQLAADADAEAKASTAELNGLIKVLITGDPEAAAEAWLDDQLAQRTRDVLKAIGWPESKFVDFLVTAATDGDLEKELLDMLNTTVKLTMPKNVLAVGEAIQVAFTDGPAALNDWIGIYPAGQAPNENSALWAYAGALASTPHDSAPLHAAGTVTLTAGPQNDGFWPLPAGKWVAHYLADAGNSSLASAPFEVR